MKIRNNFLLILACLPLAALPQATLDSVIAAVRSSNPALRSLQIQMEAEIRAGRTGIYLPNPEVQFDYLWSDPATSGNRTDFGVTQSFSFPSVYFQKASQSGLIRTGATLDYLRMEREVLLTARMTWIRMVGLNRLQALADQRMKMALAVAEKAKVQMERGEISIISYHHALMETVALSVGKSTLDVERATLQNELNLVCGGKVIMVTDTLFQPLTDITREELLSSFLQAPSVRSLENDMAVKRLDKNIAVSEWLPRFKAGYYSEMTGDLNYQGITTGISIPLFENASTVKAARYRMEAAVSQLELFKSKEAARILSLYQKRQLLNAQVAEINTVLGSANDITLLQKALDAGEINISEFFYETTLYYFTWSQLIRNETELALSDAELLHAAGR